MKIGRDRKRDIVRGIFILAIVWVAGISIISVPNPIAHASSPWIAGGWDKINAGGISTCGQLGTEAYCWGYLGANGNRNYIKYPEALDRSGDLGGSPIENVQPGYFHTCLVAEGKIYCYGRNSNGQLGIGSVSGDISSPTAVDATGVLYNQVATSVSTSSTFTCGIAGGKAFCWGANNSGQLGNSTTADSATPVAVDTSGVLAGKTVTAISTGSDGACVIADGQLYCWGGNSYGTLGNGTTARSLVPIAVDASGALAGKTISTVSFGYYNVCALANGQVYCWGYNRDGQLGDGTQTDKLVPTAVDASGILAGKNVTTVTSERDSTCVLADNLPYCWGVNSDGQLGDGTTMNRSKPVPVDTSGVLSGLSIADISLGNNHTCVVASRNAYCWGDNTFGQLGNGTSTASLVPVKVIAVPVKVSSLSSTTTTINNSTTTTMISGGDFQTGASVFFGNKEAAITSLTATSIDVTVPAASTVGPVDVKVVNPDGTSGTMQDGFSYAAQQPLSLASLSEKEVPLSGYERAAVSGHGFEQGTTFAIGGINAPVISIPAEDYAVIDIPAVESDRTVETLVASRPDGSTATLTINLSYYSFKMLSNVFLRQIGSGDDDSSEQYLSRPYGVTVDLDGNIYVTESSSDVVKVFSKAGILLRQFGSSGSNDGQFSYPTAIKIGPDSNLYVLDQRNDRVQVFTTSGNYIRQFGSSSDPDMHLYDAEAMAFDKSGNVYVGQCGYDNTTSLPVATINVFSLTGDFIRTIGKTGGANGEFNCISALNINKDGLIFAYDYSSQRLQVLSAAGEYLRQLSAPGFGNGKIGNIEDIAFDEYGNILLADTNNRIQVFDKSEKYLGQIGTDGNAEGQLNYPESLSITRDNTIVVSDYGNNRIQVFEGIARVPEPAINTTPVTIPMGPVIDSATKESDIENMNESMAFAEQPEELDETTSEKPIAKAQQDAKHKASKSIKRNVSASDIASNILRAAMSVATAHPVAVATAAAATVVSVSAAGYIFFIKP